jgi:hypothetical protein
MEFRESTDEDLAYVRANPLEDMVKGVKSTLPEHTFTAIFESQIVGIGGICVLWDGVAWAWVTLTKDCKKRGMHGIIALAAIRDKMELLLEENNIRRVQCTVRTDFDAAIKMVEHFGFKMECCMEGYWPDGTDAFLYSRIKA